MWFDLFQGRQQLFERLWLTYDPNVARDGQYFLYTKLEKLLMVSDDDVDHESASRAADSTELNPGFLR